MDTAEIAGLDAQEAGYYPTEVDVDVDGHGVVKCRTYIAFPERAAHAGPPSPIYKKVILMGAVENGLPDSYIEQIKAIEDNGRTDSEMAQILHIDPK